ncbi:MAG: hypothetical protein AB7U41_05240 [Dongiaceae bacterium]
MQKYLVQRRVTEQACRLLDNELRGFGAFKGIICIMNGGMVASEIMRNHLGLAPEQIVPLHLKSYTGQNERREVEVVGIPSWMPESGESWLILDDILGEGKTLLKALEIYPQAKCATLYSWPSGATLRRPGGGPLLSAVGARMSEPAWLIFDWEREDWHQGINDDLPFYQLEPQESLRQLWHHLRHPALQAQLTRG